MNLIKILLVEDDSDDVQLLAEALTDNGIKFTMDVIMEGDKVLPYLDQLEHIPDLIILDLNLPRMHGKDILPRIRKHSRFANTRIVVFSTSASPYDVQFAEENGADRFVTKPSTIREFNEAVELMASLAGNKKEALE